MRGNFIKVTKERKSQTSALSGACLEGDITLVLATVALVGVTGYYAWQTQRLVEEMRKDRRRQFLENALEKAYSPLFEVFRKALIDATRPRSATSSFSFSLPEISQISTVVERYGHYLGPHLLGKIRVTIVDKAGKTEWQPAEMNGLYDEIMGKSEALGKKLQSLI